VKILLARKANVEAANSNGKELGEMGKGFRESFCLFRSGNLH
jgi:hypothetical protein